jgi:hypothetical protein
MAPPTAPQRRHSEAKHAANKAAHSHPAIPYVVLHHQSDNHITTENDAVVLAVLGRTVFQDYELVGELGIGRHQMGGVWWLNIRRRSWCRA